MWLNQLFTEEPVDFERRCRMRMKVGMGIVVLGILSIGLEGILKGRIPVLYLESGAENLIPGFYRYLGFGLVAGGAVNIWRNMQYLKYPDLGKKKAIAETDERNRLLGLRCWAYTGYCMFLALYVGVLASGFISITVMKTLLAVAAVYGFILMLFRLILGRMM